MHGRHIARVVAAAASCGLFAVMSVTSAHSADSPDARASATCADYPNQAAAQRAADTRDADGDGIYCESLPCPCLRPGTSGSAPTPTPKPSCARPTAVQTLSFSKTRYPDIRTHVSAAIRAGWPSVLVLNRRGESDRRKRLLAHVPIRSGYDRDEYPPAVGRGRGKGLVGGDHPRGWMADVAYVPSGENRSQGSSLGDQLRRFCDGTRFRYVFR